MEDFLLKKLEERKQLDAFRQLRLPDGKTDFCSNDYLGIVKNRLIEEKLAGNSFKTGSTGSRLLSGNYALIEETEKQIARFHEAPAGLLFNSGYDANTGLLSCVPRRGDTIIYDQLSHASIRDGIRLSLAMSVSFLHNDLEDLHKRLQYASGNIFVVTESVFSMDGDKAPLLKIAELCDAHKAHLIIDEAHATGVVGELGEGLVQVLGLQNSCFARVQTFGKACGAHGAIVLGSELLRNYLVNFARPFIFTTSLPEASVAAIKASYDIFPSLVEERQLLNKLIRQFQEARSRFKLLRSETPIQVIIIPGNAEVKKEALSLQSKKLDIRPILYPTVAKGTERLRIVLHAFNNEEELAQIINCIR